MSEANYHTTVESLSHAEFGMRNAECEMRNAECGMRNAECGMRNKGSRCSE